LIQNESKLFFFQNRPDKNQISFDSIKLKTMNDKRDTEGKLLPDNQPLILFGRYGRKFSLDELTQVINVLKGHISLMGSRLLLFKYIPLYKYDHTCRNEVRPGTTGWAQVNGRNSISWTREFTLDVSYVDHINFSLYYKFFCMTIPMIIQRHGINQSEQNTWELLMARIHAV
jgi:lipopolysaccharide/colanic/teichoic acid biosynthesis glycosyltransferase